MIGLEKTTKHRGRRMKEGKKMLSYKIRSNCCLSSHSSLSDLAIAITTSPLPTTQTSSPTCPHLLPEPCFSQEALNSLALFDLGRSGVSVRYKPTVNHE